jgi:hypothetical protein
MIFGGGITSDNYYVGYEELLLKLPPISRTLTKLIEKNEMGGAGSAYGGEERRIQGF